MFTLPDLPFAHNALEPYIDEQTMRIHHGKHHQAYVDNLNKALEGIQEYKDKDNKDLEELLSNVDKVPEGKRQAVINNGGGHANHTFFWEIMNPGKGGVPEGKLAEAIETLFGSFDTFKEKFSEKAMTVFGSGWAFLILDQKGKLGLKRQSFQNSPLMHGNTPILGLDVWEHAYYLKYQNRRKEYVEAWWNVVNWEEVERRFEEAMK